MDEPKRDRGTDRASQRQSQKVFYFEVPHILPSPSQVKVSGSLKCSLMTVTFTLTPRPWCSSSRPTDGDQTKPPFFELSLCGYAARNLHKYTEHCDHREYYCTQ